MLDPTSYSSLADHTKLLAEESISLWQRFLLTADSDQRAPNGHFALGLLQTIRGQLDEAISEYKLVANRFPKHALAPHALLQSGKLKVRLRDYVGAHADLKQLVEMYPETDLADTACLHLADATMKAGLFEEAAGLYRKVYNLGLSVGVADRLGAGRGPVLVRDAETTRKRPNGSIGTSRWCGTRTGRSSTPPACCSARRIWPCTKPQQAHAALNLALKGDLSRQQYVETIAVLVRAYIEQGLLLEALQTHRGHHRMAAVAAGDHRAAPAAGAGASLDRIDGQGRRPAAGERPVPARARSSRARSRWSWRHAGSATATSNRPARRSATRSRWSDRDRMAQQIGRELARACLRLGQTGQAVSVCSQLLEHATGRRASRRSWTCWRGLSKAGTIRSSHGRRAEPIRRRDGPEPGPNAAGRQRRPMTAINEWIRIEQPMKTTVPNLTAGKSVHDPVSASSASGRWPAASAAEVPGDRARPHAGDAVVTGPSDPCTWAGRHRLRPPRTPPARLSPWPNS